MVDDVVKYPPKDPACPYCELELQRWFPHQKMNEFYCYRCGRELVERPPEPPKPKKEIIISDAEKLLEDISTVINAAIKTSRELEVEEKTAEVKRKECLFRGSTSYRSRTVRVESIQIQMETNNKYSDDDVYTNTDNRIVVSSMTDCIALYYPNPEVVDLLWDDLTDILALPCHEKLKIKYLKEFRIADKEYAKKVRVALEGGRPPFDRQYSSL